MTALPKRIMRYRMGTRTSRFPEAIWRVAVLSLRKGNVSRTANTRVTAQDTATVVGPGNSQVRIFTLEI